jgi:hypothetical protein
MTIAKHSLRPRGERPAAYVSREGGAAELGISPETWDRWVEAGTLPAKSPGFPEKSPRWRWADVDRKLSGEATEETAPDLSKPTLDPYIVGLGNIHGKKKGRERAAS